MKFGKEFESQMVPEWHEAYMDYNYLKILIKNIIIMYKQKKLNHGTTGHSRSGRLYQTFSGLTSFPRHLHHHHDDEHQVYPDDDVEDHPQPAAAALPISINSKSTAVHEDYLYETQFFMTGDVGGEYELVFFRRLDDSLIKLTTFTSPKWKKL
ncbi:unnamed protein product [Rhodiola kirilowii]